MPVPTFKFTSRPTAGPFSVVDSDVSDVFFETLSSGDQQGFIRAVKAFRAEASETKANVIDLCNWQLAKCLRYSTPTRIAEAALYLEQVIAHFNSAHTNGEVDVTPMLYLSVALHKEPGQEDAAFKTQLWSRACFSRLLRRTGRVADAEQQEEKIRDYIKSHLYAITPNDFRALLTDPEHEGRDYVLDHPVIENAWAGITEIGPVPTFTFVSLPAVGPVSVLDQQLTAGPFEHLPATEQKGFIDVLEAFREEVNTKGNDADYLDRIGCGATLKRGVTVAQTKALVFDVCNWQLAKCLRPTRIAEAAPYLEQVIAHFNTTHANGEVDVTPVLYLAVALHQQPGQEDAAVRHFESAYAYAPSIESQFHTQLWSREENKILPVESSLRNAPSSFCELVADPGQEGKDHILDHPAVKKAWAGMTEIGPGLVMQFE
ncbi:hypothetical protein B0H10DRAFT_2222838 [Mycena sp. CBHHK59/15]|nr:hypothetical protein B0H10DRAFT_2222838 [Mycena sp. CBHHK59/15]